MKIAFLRPNLGGQRSNDAIEPLGFAVLSGLTDRKKHEVVLFDERIEDIPMDLEVDLVVITTFTLTAKRAYTIADNYRKKGIYVVIGGYHASLIPEEVQEYADTVFVGSAEGNWARFLIELENGNPQKVYEEIKLPDISEVVYDRSIFKDKRYSFVVPVQFGRGCMHQCEFCTIGSVHKGDYAHRRVELVIEEIKEIFKTNKRAKVIYFVDDNIFANKKKALHLFNELKKLRIKWACQGSIDIAKDEELVKLMSESGCIEMLLGFENINIMNIKKMNKKSNYDFDYENIIKKSKSIDYKKKVQIIFQNPFDSFDPMWDVKDSLLEIVSYHKLAEKGQEMEYIKSFVRACELDEELLSKRPNQLSGGQLQRLSIARVLCLRPKVIIADEILTALDVSVQSKVIQLLKDLHNSNDFTLIFISHDLNTVRKIADRIVVMKEGEIVEDNDTKSIFTSPKMEYTKMLIEAIPKFDVDNM